MKKRAFTLFELLVSISIIGILIAVASMSYGSAQKKARDTRRIEDLKSIQKAMEMYYSNNNSYPTNNFQTNLSPYLVWPTGPKGETYQPIIYLSSTYCIGVSMDNPIGNCNSSCNSGTSHYCVKNQQ